MIKVVKKLFALLPKFWTCTRCGTTNEGHKNTCKECGNRRPY